MEALSLNLKLNLKDRIKLFSTIINNAVIYDDKQDSYTLETGIIAIVDLLSVCRLKKSTTFIIGNGGSAAIAGHAAIDLLNMAKIQAISLQESATITCISNDYGYEQVYSRQLKQFICPDDVLIAISSSGQSKNILNGVDIAKNIGAKVITFSGFSAENPLCKSGDLNLWLNSHDYGFVEIGHAFILHNITDRLRISERNL